MIRCLTVLACLIGPGVIAFGTLVAQDKGQYCKAGHGNCSCLVNAKHKWQTQFQTEALWKLSLTCWGEIAQFRCGGKEGKKTAEVMPVALAQAKKQNKLVLYFGGPG